ncbi:MAG TPA: family 20 glycosylhydrolase [Steroidobacteraceae bacterium]|nr:family 20 glycosylhydrolase [Steroidobacteraceae bacterium]
MGVIPAPLQIIPGQGQFNIRSGTPIAYVGDALAPIVERFRAEVARRTGLTLVPARAAPATDAPSLRIELAAAIDNDFDALPRPTGVSPAGDALPDERYSLAIGAEGIVLRSVAAIGAARGLTTLLQLLATTPKDAQGAIALPVARILDVPRFAWRGLTLDLSRTFFTTHEIRRVIDLVALYKLNVLHLHLTDDQAWRLEAGRPPTRRAGDDTFYSNAELRGLVSYAAERFVTLVPGIETPGHAAALLKLRPELDSGRNAPGLDVESDSRSNHRGAWLDPEGPATFALIDQVLAEVAGIFPAPFVHIGGDQPFGMPEPAYLAYVQHVRERLGSLGKRPVGWQESIRGGADVRQVIQVSMSSDRFQASLPEEEGKGPLPSMLSAAAAGTFGPSREDIEQALTHSVPVIVSPVSHACFDVPYAERSANAAQEALRARVGQRRYPARTVAEFFDWEPARVLGSSARPEDMAGVGATIWTETVADFDDLTFLLLPRLAGFAHKSWSEPRANVWSEHRQSLALHRRLWAQDELTFFQTSTVEW